MPCFMISEDLGICSWFQHMDMNDPSYCMESSKDFESDFTALTCESGGPTVDHRSDMSYHDHEKFDDRSHYFRCPLEHCALTAVSWPPLPLATCWPVDCTLAGRRFPCRLQILGCD